jgi:hypothetical protein
MARKFFDDDQFKIPKVNSSGQANHSNCSTSSAARRSWSRSQSTRAPTATASR